MSRPLPGRIQDIAVQIIEALESDAELCARLDYDPNSENAAAAKIQRAHAPWEHDHDAIVVVDPQPDGSTPDNAATELTFTCSVTFEVSRQWFREDFTRQPSERDEILALIDETMLEPGIPGLRNVQGIEFNRSAPDPNYMRAWSAVYNYSRTALYTETEE